MAIIDTLRLAQDCQRGLLAPLYLLFGEEDFLMEEALHSFGEVAARCPFPTRERCLGKEVVARDLLESACTLPLGGGLRLIVVEEAQGTPVSEREKLLPYLENPCPTTCLVFAWRAKRLEAKDKFLSALRQRAQVVEFARLWPGDFKVWARTRVKSLGLSVETAALEALIAGSGGSLRDLAAELDKAALSVPQGGRLTLAHLSALSRHASAKPWEVAELACRGEAAGALLALADLMEAGTTPGAVLAAVSRHLRKLLLVAEMEEGGLGEPEMAQRLRIYPTYVRGYLEQARRGRGRLARMLSEVLSAEYDLKTSAAPERERLERLVLSLAG